MASKVSLTIDGVGVQAEEGMNLIEAAALVGVHVPNLCYIKGMRGVGACRLCLVEVQGAKAPVIACNAKVKEGMDVKTDTDALKETRGFVIDMVLSMHPLDCMTCTKAGVCTLQKYAYELGIKESSFTRKKFGYPTDEKNPFIKRDPEYCILCGKCVRTCKEQGTNVLDFMGRGVGSKVVTANDKPLQESECTFCGSCVDACPVNSLLEADRWTKGREWEYEKVSSVCLSCGCACDICVSTRDGLVTKINAGADEGSARNYICAYGRYGFDSLAADSRITTPLIKENNKLREATWDEAIEAAAKGLKKAVNQTGIISSAGIQNEDALLLCSLANDVLKTKHLDSSASLYSEAGSLINSQQADIDQADLIMLVGLDASQWSRVVPAIDAALRRREERGAKLIVLNSADTALANAATLGIKADEAQTLKSIAKAMAEAGLSADEKLDSALQDAKVSEEAAQAAQMIKDATEPLIIASPALFGAAANLSLIKGKAVCVPAEGNARGVALMGLAANGLSFKEMSEGGGDLKALYVVGEVLLKKAPKVDFLVAAASHVSAASKAADVVLPAAVSLESAGTVVDFLGNLKYMPGAAEPAGDSLPHKDIIIKLSKALGTPLKRPTEAEVKKAASISQGIKLSPFEKVKGLDPVDEKLMDAVNAAVIKGSRLLWLKEACKDKAEV